MTSTFTTEHDTGAPAGTPPEAGDKTTAELAGDLSRQITGLIHSEIQLAKTEVAEKGRRLGFGAGGFGASGLLALCGVGCLITATVAAVHLALALWVAALVVAGGCFVVAACAALVARGQLKQATPPLPTEAMESTKEDVQWLKTHAKSANR